MTMMQGLSLTGVPVAASAKKRGEYWLHGCLSQVKVMHKVLARLYDGLETDAVYDIDFEDDDVLSLEGDSWKLCQIFADCSYKLVKRMTDSTNGPVEFPLSQIISVLRRCLCVSYSDVLSVPSRTDLAALLPHLHQCSMDVLAQLIICCGRNILHYSHIIVDLCLQTLVSTAKMPLDSKFCTKSSTYQALVMWVKTCGWGKYLSSHWKFLTQEIIADTQADAEEGLGKKTESDESKANDRLSGRVKKGKRKKGQRGDSYMELEAKEYDKGKEQSDAARENLVLSAFSLSQLAMENLPFSLSQTLISHLIKTASTVQRLSPNRPQPYKQIEARKGLYQTVAGCLLSSLESSGNRMDAITHYQLTNSALDILVRACHGDDSQIEMVCSQVLATVKSSANLKGPVIRKVLDFDDSGVEDIGQLMRENEQQSDCIEGLRQKLMNSEVENEQQSRLISSLREQVSILQSKVPSVTQQSSSISTIAESRLSQDKKMLNENDGDEAVSDDDYETDEINVNIDEVRNSSSADELEIITADDKHPKSENLFKKEKNVSLKVEPDSCIKNKDLEKNKNDDCTITSMKRISDATASLEKESKRLKVDNKEKTNNRIEDMLLDFVDAPPDS